MVVLCTLNHPDREGDLIPDNALANGATELAVVSAGAPGKEHGVINHDEDPVGTARLYEKDGRLWAEVNYDGVPKDWPHDGTPPSLTPGQACNAVNKMRPAWSVGYQVLAKRDPTPAERARGVRRVILKWRIVEISPVREPGGAAVGTLEASCAA